MLPNFLIIGAPKSGTTALYELLRQHPDVFMPGLKEPLYFCDGIGVKEREEYEALFHAASNYKCIGEASTNYLYAPEAPKRIFEEIGRVKIIAVLRDPVDQMFSMFYFNKRNGLEDYGVSFLDALELENERRFKRENPVLFYRARAHYFAGIRRYINYYGLQNMYVTTYERFCAEKKVVIQEIFKFLDIDSSFMPIDKRVNYFGEPRVKLINDILNKRSALKKALRFIPPNIKSTLRRKIRDWNTKETKYPQLNEDIRLKLAKEFTEDIEGLSEIFGERFCERWKSFKICKNGR